MVQRNSPSGPEQILKSLGVSLNFASIAAGATGSLTTAVAGAEVGDPVLVQPAAALTENILVYGYVSAAGVVTVIACNQTAAPIDPAALDYNVFVWKSDKSKNSPSGPRLITKALAQALDFPSIALGAFQELTVAVAGVTTEDAVQVVPLGADVASLVYTAYVTTAGQVVVRAYNASGAPIDPASREFNVFTWKAGLENRESPSGKRRILSSVATVDLASVASGGTNTASTIAVTGAEVGDACQVKPLTPGSVLAGLNLDGVVTAAGTVTIRATNATGGALDAASQDYAAYVWKD